jgi:hypothetical protein
MAHGDGSNVKSGCLTLFGLPFLLAGLGVLSYAGTCWLTYLRSASWVQVPATIESAQLAEHVDSEGDTTYSVDATYTYEFGGTVHTGHRVGIMGGSSSSYGHHAGRHEILEEHRTSGEPFTARVDPENPSQAILFREPQPWMYILVPFGLVFAGAGAFLIGWGIVSASRARRLRAFLETQGNRFWLMREDWAGMRVTASNLKELLTAWAMGIGLSLFMSVFLIAIASSAAPVFARVIVWTFTAIAVLALLRAAGITVRQIIYGTPQLFLDEIPIVPGRSVACAVRTRRPVNAGRWRCRLLCRQKTWDRSGGESRQVTSTLFRHDLSPVGPPTPSRTGGTLIPLRLQVPVDKPGTAFDDDCTVTWTLEVKAKTQPWPFSASFELPVFFAAEEEVTRTPGTD